MKLGGEIFVYSVLPGSIAEEAGIEPGDVILSINNQNINDVFDYRFLSANEELLLCIKKQDGEEWEVEIEKEEYEEIGIEFEKPMIDDAKSCTNKCIFCFIDQLPKGMRNTLYFKDDDSRLSFLTGNYVTLTNTSMEDIDRVIKYKMSPINVSVHTTNPDLRINMLNNKFAGDVLDKIGKLTKAGITVNCQIVLCRGINDKNELDRTLRDLTSYYPDIYSISVVPVGITRYREGLRELIPYDGKASQEVINQVSAWQEEMIRLNGSRVVYLADEFYLMAGNKLPLFEEYEDFPQIENGVGLIASLENEFNEFLQEVDFSNIKEREVSIATGVSAYKHIRELANILEENCTKLKINVFEIKNEFFGQNVTVTGLLTGNDILNQLKGKRLGNELLICRSMLKSGETVFLDDVTLEELQEGLDIKVTIVDNDGKDFILKLIEINR